MRFFEKLRKLKSDNKGVTMVELLCAIGILSLVGSAVVGLVVVATDSYQRSVMEIEVQQEAQFAANLVGDLLKDSTQEPQVSADMNTITIYEEGAVYTVEYKPEERSLFLNGQLLAEYVDGPMSVGPTYTGSKTYEVKMGVARDDAPREYAVNNSNNARNQKPDGIPEEGDFFATILCPSEMVLEPRMDKEIVYTVTGISDTTVNWYLSGNTDSSTKLVGNTIIIGSNETAPILTIVGETNQKKRDNSTPAGSTVITVYVRRVNSVNLRAELVSGSDGSAGALYRFYANVTGNSADNLKRKSSIETDYVSPYYINWNDTFFDHGSRVPDGNESSYFTVVSTHTGDTPDSNYREYRLNRNVESGSRFIIEAQAAHPKGTRNDGAKGNKTGLTYASVSANYVIEGHIYTLYPGNFYRGTDQAQGSLEEWTVKQLVGSQHGIDPNQLQVFKEVRYKVTGTNNWTPWIQMNEGGNAIRIHEDSWMFACDKDYDIEIRFGARNNWGQKLYPTDLGESAYTIRTGLQHVRIRFDVSGPGFNQTGIYGVGPASAPIRLRVNNNLYFNVNQQEASRQAETGIRWDRFNKSLVIKIQKYLGNKWVDVPLKFRNDWGDVDVKSSADSGRNLAEMTRTGNYLTFTKKGSYRILIGLGNAMGGDSVRLLTYNGSGFNTTYENYDLWNEATGEGIFYVTVD